VFLPTLTSSSQLHLVLVRNLETASKFWNRSVVFWHSTSLGVNQGVSLRPYRALSHSRTVLEE